MPINIAQVRLQVIANNNGTFAEPISNAFRPDPYQLLLPQIAVTLSATSQQADAVTLSPVPGMMFATALTLPGTMTITSLSAKNIDPAQTIWLRFSLAATSLVGTDPLQVPPTNLIPILGGGIISLSTPLNPNGPIILYTPSIGMSLDFMVIGSYLS